MVVSEFEYESPGPRFGAYWTLQLSDAVTPGLWALEAVVDGVPAGMHAFQVLASAEPNLTQAGRPQLTPAQLYERIGAATATVHRLDGDGQKVAAASGFLVPGGRLLTTFAIVDGASRLRATLADGQTAELDHILAWDRRGDWALFEHGLDAEPLALGPQGTEQIGDRCFSLDVPLEDSRVLAEGRVVGFQTFPEVGDRLSVSFPLTGAARGGPVVNIYGEAIGIAVSPGTWPGLASLDALRLTRPFRMSGRSAAQSAVALVTPLRRIDLDSSNPPVPLRTLFERGEFLQSLVESPHVGRGLLLRELDEKKVSEGMPPMEGDFEFSRSKGVLIVFVYWNPLAELDTKYHLEVYDLDNRQLLRGDSLRLKMKAYTRSHTWWSLDIGNLRPAIYRVDLVMGDQAVWRDFFRVVD